MTSDKDKKFIYILLCCGCITISFNVAAIAAVIPAISMDLKLPDFLVSKIIPAYMIPYGLGALLYAPLTKHTSYKVILSVSLGLYACASLYCSLIFNINELILGRMLMGITGSSAIPLGLIVIGQLFERNVRGRLVGLFFGCSFFASIAGILVSGIGSWRLLFSVPACLGALTTAGILLLKGEHIRTIHGADVDYIKTFKTGRIRDVFLFIFVISFLYHGVHKWFGVYLDRIYGMDKLAISMFFVMMSVAAALGQIGGGVISDFKGRYASCITGLLVLSLGTVMLFTTYPPWALAVILSLISIGWTIGHNGVSTVLTDFPEEFRPAIASLNSSVRFVSGGLGFFVSGLFVEKSFTATFLVIGLCMLSCASFLKRVVRQ